MEYMIKYEECIHLDYLRQIGAAGLEYINEEEMKKQRSVIGYMIKTVGSNLLQGKSIMSISLPINISDYRSNTEMYKI
jgi:hypothetical protein